MGGGDRFIAEGSHATPVNLHSDSRQLVRLRFVAQLAMGGSLAPF